MSTANLTLPFAVEADDNEAFTLNMETAAVLLSAEAERRKLGFLEASEKIMFVSKMYYPLWLIPWGEKSLVLDGLNVFSSLIKYQKLPSFETFLEDVEQGASIRGQLKLALEKHKKVFNDFAGSVEAKIDALISDRELLSAIFEYVKETAALQSKESLAIVMVPPMLDASKAIEGAKQLLDLHSKVRSDIMGLEYVKKVLMDTLDFHEQMITKEIKFTQESYSEKISKLLPAIEEKLSQLEKKRDAEIANVNRTLESILKIKAKERERRERELQKLELLKTDLTKKQDLQKRRSKIGVAHIGHKIKLCESKIRETKKRLHDIIGSIEQAQKQNKAEIEKLCSFYQGLVDKEKNKITSLEDQCKEKVLCKQKEMETLKLTIDQIAKQIEDLIENKRQMEDKFEELTLHWQTLEDVSLVCLPFYLAGYKAGSKTQLHIFPPVKVSSPKGVLKTFQKTLLGFTAASKMKPFLKSRSKVISRMLNFALKKRINSDKAFAEALRSATASANILVSQRFKETLTKGLEELKAKNWIGQKEIDIITESYLQEES